MEAYKYIDKTYGGTHESLGLSLDKITFCPLWDDVMVQIELGGEGIEQFEVSIRIAKDIRVERIKHISRNGLVKKAEDVLTSQQISDIKKYCLKYIENYLKVLNRVKDVL